jgi:uncharacterized protein (DUF2147 family)
MNGWFIHDSAKVTLYRPQHVGHRLQKPKTLIRRRIPMHLSKSFAVAFIAAALAATPALPSLAADPTGTWQSKTGESRYSVTYCGDGTQLCAKLTWLREDARTEENLAYLNRYVVKGATPTGENSWQGNLAYEGDVYEGKVEMTDANEMSLKGCQGMFCKSMNFIRL